MEMQLRNVLTHLLFFQINLNWQNQFSFRYHGYGHGKGYGSLVERRFFLQDGRTSRGGVVFPTSSNTTLTPSNTTLTPSNTTSADANLTTVATSIPSSTLPSNSASVSMKPIVALLLVIFVTLLMMLD